MRLLLIACLALLLSGCCDRVCLARTAVNVERDYLAMLHAELVDAYRADQVAATKAVPGDPHDEKVKTAKKAAVAKVRARWVPVWKSYAVAHAAWMLADDLVRDQERALLSGYDVDEEASQAALADLARAIAELIYSVPPAVSYLSLSQ